MIKGLLIGHHQSPATLKCNTADHTCEWNTAEHSFNIFLVIILRWSLEKTDFQLTQTASVTQVHTNSAIIYRHTYMITGIQGCYPWVFFFPPTYSTYFKDSRSNRRVHSYFSAHSSHQHSLIKYAANCIDCTSTSSTCLFMPIISVTGQIFTCIACIGDLSIYHIPSFPDPHSSVTEKQKTRAAF